MKISAIIPAYNAELYLERAVRSVIDTGYSDLEIVIIDDGSRDSTYAIAMSLSKEFTGVVFVFQHQKNSGVSASRNLGIEKSNGDLICFLDADDYVLNHRFEVAADILQSQVEVDGVYELTRMEFGTPPGDSIFWDRNQLFGITKPLEKKALLEELLKGGCWATSAFLCHRKLFQKTGLFPTDYKFSEDYHLWLRAACVGTLVPGNMDKPVSIYFRHGRNTYQGGLERKPDMIRAMNDVYCWGKKQPFIQISKKNYVRKVQAYIKNALIVARENKQLSVARKIIGSTLQKGDCTMLLNTAILLQVFWVLIGRSTR